MVARHQPSIGQGLWNHNDEIYWQRCTQLLTSTNFNHNIHFLPQTSWQFYPPNPRGKCISGVENRTTNKAESYQTSKIEFFVKIVNGWKLKANFWRFPSRHYYCQKIYIWSNKKFNNMKKILYNFSCFPK